MENRHPIINGDALPDLIQDNQAAIAGMVENIGRLDHPRTICIVSYADWLEMYIYSMKKRAFNPHLCLIAASIILAELSVAVL